NRRVIVLQQLVSEAGHHLPVNLKGGIYLIDITSFFGNILGVSQWSNDGLLELTGKAGDRSGLFRKKRSDNGINLEVFKLFKRLFGGVGLSTGILKEEVYPGTVAGIELLGRKHGPFI